MAFRQPGLSTTPRCRDDSKPHECSSDSYGKTALLDSFGNKFKKMKFLSRTSTKLVHSSQN